MRTKLIFCFSFSAFKTRIGKKEVIHLCILSAQKHKTYNYKLLNLKYTKVSPVICLKKS